MSAAKARRALRELANAGHAKTLHRFFKTAPGEYAAGDRFLGIRVPDTRSVARRFSFLPLRDLETLVRSRWHEERALALMIAIRQFQRGTEAERDRIAQFYLANLEHVNNWDLVDMSAEHILGAHKSGDAKRLAALARSKSLWERRIAMMATFEAIRHRHFKPALRIAKMLLRDEHDLIHKAVGWMLREIGNRDRAVEEEFLRKHLRVMHRTTLRYAIERFPEPARRAWLL